VVARDTALVRARRMAARKVDVEVGIAYRPIQPKLPASCCVVGIAPEGMVPIGQRYHFAKVRSSRGRGSVGADQIRLNPSDDLSGLPGLDSRPPSMIRDTVRLAFSAGARSVDVLLARIEGKNPWDLHDEEARETLDAFLFDQLGAMVVMPDAAGPPSLSHYTELKPSERWHRITRTIRRWEETWRERYQVGVFDCPDGRLEPIHNLLDETQGGDFMLCGWRGADLRLRAHGWRSAAGLTAGILARRNFGVIQGIEGRVVELGEGRRIHGNRRQLLGGDDTLSSLEPVDEFCVLLDIHPNQERARIRSELTCRRPFRGWPLPAMRTVKAIHYMIREAASHFVFTNVNALNAFNLSNTLRLVLRPYIAQGMLIGPGGNGAPKITGSFDRNPTAPALIADITAQLQPWCRQVKVGVSLQEGLEPKIEMEV
jgi:hypothetical protein